MFELRTAHSVQPIGSPMRIAGAIDSLGEPLCWASGGTVFRREHRRDAAPLRAASRRGGGARLRRDPWHIRGGLLPRNTRARAAQPGKGGGSKTYEEGYFTAFPDLAPEDEGYAFGDDVMVVWGTLRGTSSGEWMGVPPSGRSFVVPFRMSPPSAMDSWKGRPFTSISPRYASRPRCRSTMSGQRRRQEQKLRPREPGDRASPSDRPGCGSRRRGFGRRPPGSPCH